MKPNTQPTPLEVRMEKIAAGYRAIEDKTMSLVFEEGKLLPDELVTRFQKGSHAFARVKLAEAELMSAIAERDKLIPSLKRLCEEATLVAKRHYGGDAEKMATFGVAKPATRKAKPRSAKSKAAPTRPKREPRMIKPHCAGAELVEEEVTVVVEEVVIPCQNQRRARAKTRTCAPKRSRSKR